MKWMQRSMVALLVAGTLSMGLAGPAAAQLQISDGLVNVTVGDIEILNDARIAVAARVVALICGLNVGDVIALAQEVDSSGDVVTADCESVDAPITIEQN
jgi:hypothetical protein